MYTEWDNAALTIMKHYTEAWKHSEFKDVINKVGNSEIFYKAMQFYLDYEPMLLPELMT
eukprot:Pgem_evm1s18033